MDVASQRWGCDGCPHELVKSKFWTCIDCGYEEEGKTSFDLCGKCFRAGRTARQHQTSHRMITVNNKHISTHINPIPTVQAMVATTSTAKLANAGLPKSPSLVWPSSNAFGTTTRPVNSPISFSSSSINNESANSPQMNSAFSQLHYSTPMLSSKDSFSPAAPKRTHPLQSNHTPPSSPEKRQNMPNYQHKEAQQHQQQQQQPTSNSLQPSPKHHRHSHSPHLPHNHYHHANSLRTPPHHHRSLSTPSGAKKSAQSAVAVPPLTPTVPLARPIPVQESLAESSPPPDLSSTSFSCQNARTNLTPFSSDITSFSTEDDVEAWAKLIGLDAYPKFLKHVSAKSALAFEPETDAETFLFFLANNQQALRVFVTELDRLKAHLTSTNQMPNSPRSNATSSDSATDSTTSSSTSIEQVSSPLLPPPLPQSSYLLVFTSANGAVEFEL